MTGNSQVKSPYSIQIYNFNVYKLNILESCNNAIHKMRIKSLIILKNIDKTQELTELTGMTDCDGLDIVTRVYRANGTEELMDPTELTELMELTEPTELTESRN